MPTSVTKLQNLINRMKTDLDKYIATGKASPQAVAARKDTINQLVEYYNDIEGYITDLHNQVTSFSFMFNNPVTFYHKLYERDRKLIDPTGIEDLLTLSEHKMKDALQLYDLANTLQKKGLSWYK